MTKSSRIVLYFIALVAATLLVFVAYTWAMLHISYSDGERAGYLQKVFHPWLDLQDLGGEILLTSMPGAIPEKFEFSVRDEVVARQLTDATGKRVILSYSQHKGVPTQCFGETEYYITKVQVQP